MLFRGDHFVRRLGFFFLFVILACCLIGLAWSFRHAEELPHTQYPHDNKHVDNLSIAPDGTIDPRDVEDIETLLQLEEAGLVRRRAPAKSRPDIAPDRMNPLSCLDPKAQELSYPPGVDTVAYWGNGRFSIVLDAFYDGEAGDRAIYSGIKAFRYDKPVVYCRGGVGFLSVDVVQGVVKKHKRRKDIPPEEQPHFQKLEDETQKDTFFIDPKTFRVTRGGG